MSHKENAVGVKADGVSEGQQTTTGNPGEGIMSTSLQEVNGMPEQYQEIGRQALERFRRMIAHAMKALHHEADSPRYVEALLRQTPAINHPTHMFEVKDLTVERDVWDAIQAIDLNYRTSLYEAWCERLKIPRDAYVDIYIEMGLIDKIQIKPVPQQVVV